MRRLSHTAATGLGVLTLAGCPEPTLHQARVELTIDGRRHGYTTGRAQWDQQEKGGRYSIYLRPDDESALAPYVCLRTYVGNPVAQLWVRYTRTPAEAGPSAPLTKYECFVPGTLADGRPTLGWTYPNGQKRPRNQTGDASCQASLTRRDNELHLSFDAELPLFVKKQAESEKGEKRASDLIRASGSAVLDL